MSYRSEVGLILTKDADKKLRKRISNLKNKEEKTLVRDLLAFLHRDESKESQQVFYHHDSIKWYGNDHAVLYIEDFLDTISEDDYLFCRVGEDLRDIEERGYMTDNHWSLSVVRSVAFIPEKAES